MREIKFRAFNGSEIIHLPPYFLVPKEKAMYGRWDIMQFTGLKDKNGKDIYEGDIVKKSGIGEMNGHIPAVKMVGRVKKIVFHEGAFYLTKSLKSAKYRLKSSTIRYYQLEIIGNIYENPELLITKQTEKP